MTCLSCEVFNKLPNIESCGDLCFKFCDMKYGIYIEIIPLLNDGILPVITFFNKI